MDLARRELKFLSQAAQHTHKQSFTPLLFFVGAIIYILSGNVSSGIRLIQRYSYLIPLFDPISETPPELLETLRLRLVYPLVFHVFWLRHGSVIAHYSIVRHLKAQTSRGFIKASIQTRWLACWLDRLNAKCTNENVT